MITAAENGLRDRELMDLRILLDGWSELMPGQDYNTLLAYASIHQGTRRLSHIEQILICPDLAIAS